MTPRIELRTLGGFAFSIDGVAAPALATQKARALLSYLVSNRGRAIARDTLVDLFWPDADVENARKNLNTALWSIRKSVRACGSDPETLFASDKLAVRWTADVLYDAERFEQTEDPALYTGDFLEGDIDEWIVAQRERLGRIFEAALGARVRNERSSDAARRLLERDPFSIEAYDTVIADELARGRPAVAAAVVARARAALHELDPELEHRFAQTYAHLETTETRTRELRLPFIGRAREIELFRAMLAGKREPGALIITGIAGSGKSSLLDQFTRVALDRGAHLISVNALEGDRRAFGPWERLYEQRSGQPFSSFAETAGAVPALALGRAIVSTIPPGAVVCVDNVQFFESDAIETLAAIANELRGRNATIVCATRPQVAATVRTMLGVAAERELALASLKRDELTSALLAFDGERFEALAEILYERSEGHAFFVTQLLDFFVSEGAVTYEGSRWRFDAGHPSLRQIPPGARRFVEDRLRALGDDAVVVAAALALDVDADAEEIARASGVSNERVYDAFDDLLLHGFVQSAETGPQFTFGHDLIRETAATLLPPARRLALHRAFAEIAQQSTMRGSAVRIARHLRAAKKPLEAAAHFEQAIFEALGWNAYAQAESIAQEAIASIADAAPGPERERNLNTCKRIMSFLRLRMASQESVGYATEALAHARAAQDAMLELRSYSARAQAYAVCCNDYESALKDLAELERLSGELEHHKSRALVLILRGFAFFVLDDCERALELYESAWGESAERERWDYAAAAAQYAMRVCASTWQFERLGRYRDRAYDAGRRFGRIGLAMTSVYDAHASYILGRYDESVGLAHEATRILRDLQGETVSAMTMHVPPDQLAFEALAVSVMAKAASGASDDAKQMSATLARMPYAELNQETKTSTAILRADALLAAAGDAGELAGLMTVMDADHRFQEPWSTLRTGAIEASFAAARLGYADARDRLHRAHKTIAQRAAQKPRDVLPTLCALAAAAHSIGDVALESTVTAEALQLKNRFDARLTVPS